MASSMLSTATVASINGSPAQATMVAPFSGLRSTSSFPVTKKTTDITSVATNGGRVQCMQVWPPLGLKKFETLSYLPQLTREQLAKEVDYLLKNKWIPCLEFDCGSGFISRDYHSSPGYYDGRYWTMWKLPMYGCTDPAQVLNEVDEAVKAYPDSFVRIIGFDNNRQSDFPTEEHVRYGEINMRLDVKFLSAVKLCGFGIASLDARARSQRSFSIASLDARARSPREE
ncbi:hypothetical protein ACFE04_005912 [Oxalis oulophora]